MQNKSAENLPEYEVETKTKPHVYRLQQNGDTGMGRGRYLKSGISIGIYL